ncbi:MAG: hypothetical protein WCO56_28445 [Verrucomicrobiota bacterium]
MNTKYELTTMNNNTCICQEKFLLFVTQGAIARDFTQGTHDSYRIAQLARAIPAAEIPEDATSAVIDFLAYLDRRTRAKRWMIH